MLDVSLSAMDPFSMDGVELRLGGLSNSPHKDGKDWFSLGARKVEKDQITLAQKTMVWVPVLEVGRDQTSRVVAFILDILVCAAEIVDVA
jgi:hypothetical protein